MVKVKKTASKTSSHVAKSTNETFVVAPVQENDEEMEDIENSDDEGEENEDNESEIYEDDVPAKRMKPAPKKVQRKENEENDFEISEDDVPQKRVKPAPKRVQRRVKEKEEKPPANLAKVLKSKGKNKKAAVANTSSNSDSQPSKSSGAKQKMLDVILNGLSTMDTKKGVSFPALKKYIFEEDGASSIARWERVRPKIKAALEQGIQEELIVRPKGSENVTGLQGSFKLNKTKNVPKKSSTEKRATNAKDSAPAKTTAKVSKSETGKKPLKTKSKEAESLPKKKIGSVKHRRSVSEDTRMSEWKPKKLNKSKSMETIPEGPKKKLKVKKKTPKKK